jgi:hypothetical protein
MLIRSVLLAVCLTHLVLPPTTSAQTTLSGVRSMDADVVRALLRALAISPTVRSLVVTLEHSDLIVHAVAGTHLPRGVAGMLQFATAAGGYRYVRITLDASLSSDQMVAMLGHELQHAVEVARAPSIVDVESFRRFYRAAGDACGSGSERYDTPAAREVGYRVLTEIRQPTVRASR